jgi:hypothetical protein
MVNPEADPNLCYKLAPDHMERGIQWYLDPVIAQLAALGTEYGTAHGEVAQALDSQAPGWFGGEGNGTVRAATTQFFAEVAEQLALLTADQNALHASLQDYRNRLQGHIDWARQHEQQCAARFTSLQSELGGAV